MVSCGEAFVGTQVNKCDEQELQRRLDSVDAELQILESMQKLCGNAYYLGCDLATGEDLEFSQLKVVSGSSDDGWELVGSRHLRHRTHTSLVLGVSRVAEGEVVTIQTYNESSIGQRWVYDGGFLQTAMDSSLVISLTVTSSNSASVQLATKRLVSSFVPQIASHNRFL